MGGPLRGETRHRQHSTPSAEPEPTTPELLRRFWEALGLQRDYYEEPDTPHPDPIFRMRTQPGFIFDDSFWEVFERFPFRICHVAYYGPERLEGETPPPPGVFELRWTLADLDRRDQALALAETAIVALDLSDEWSLEQTPAEAARDGMRKEGCAAVGGLEAVFLIATSGERGVTGSKLDRVADIASQILVDARHCDHEAHLQAERGLRGRLAEALRKRSMQGQHKAHYRNAKTGVPHSVHIDWAVCPGKPCASDRALIREAAQAEEAHDG